MDGLFFANTLILLSVMMVYKYWDSITKEDLEFSVGAPLLAMSDDYHPFVFEKSSDLYVNKKI